MYVCMYVYIYIYIYIDEELGAPAAKVYESKSGGIVDILEDVRGEPLV